MTGQVFNQARLHRKTQDEFATLSANTVAKQRHQAGVNGQVMAEVLLTTEVLPVRILGPCGNDFLVTDAANVGYSGAVSPVIPAIVTDGPGADRAWRISHPAG
jgi:hypothetical protein